MSADDRPPELRDEPDIFEGIAPTRTGRPEAPAPDLHAQANGEQAGKLPRFVDLAPFLDGDCSPERPTVADIGEGKCLFYRGRLNSIFSEPGLGKSNVLTCAAGSEIHAGRSVVILDPEDNPRGFVTRATLFGLDRRAVADRVFYLHNPSPEDVRDAQEWAAKTRPSLIVLDGLAEAMAGCGLDEDKAGDVLSFFRSWLRPFAEQAGSAVVIADHVAKSREDRGRFARGSGAKLGRLDGVAYALELGKPYAPGTEGFLRLRVCKDRNGGVGPVGFVAAELHFSPDAAEESATVCEWQRPQAEAGEWKPTAIMDKVIAHLKLYTEDNKNGICQSVKAKRTVVFKAIECLAEEGRIVILPSGKSHRIRLAEGKE